jgi:NADH:ubiquinone oxidoreductase subunit 2 (subunit N)
MVTAVVAAFLYLRIVVSIYLAAETGEPAPRLAVPVPARLGLAACALVSLAIGFFPDLVEGPADDGQPALVEYQETAPPEFSTGS